MAVTVTDDPLNLRLNHLTAIDMASLTQSELLSLSLLSTSTTTSNDAVFFSSSPTLINPSFSNDSTTSQNQTYSNSHPKRRYGFSLIKQDRSECNSIVNFLKHYLQFGHDSNLGERKRKNNKRENVRKEARVEIVNKNGVMVDLAALAEDGGGGGGGPYGDELKRRAAGMEREEDLLRMLAGIEGEWCSPRKKRRVVEACLLGDALPVGWKLIIALRRKAGRFSPYCRRYISPTGEQLSSCKEVSSYLQPYFGINDAGNLRNCRVEFQQLRRVDLENHPCIRNSMLGISESTISNTYVPIQCEKDVSILGIDNLPDVQVRDLYECHTCNVTFDKKDKYMQHLLSFHRRTTRRYRLGSSVGEGVIIKDGNFECQFCHKVFEERRRYLGHVGNHVKSSARRSEALPVKVIENTSSFRTDQFPATTGISRMDALIEIAQSSIQETFPMLEKEPSRVNNVDKCSIPGNSRVTDAIFETKKNSSSCFIEFERVKDIAVCKTSLKELDYLGNVNEVSMFDGDISNASSCPNETLVEKDYIEDKALSKELKPCDKVSEISMTDRDINESSGCYNELELEKDCGKGKSSSEENPCDKVRQMIMTEGNINDPRACTNELQMEKAKGKDKSSSQELNPCDEGREVIMTEGKIDDPRACLDELKVRKDNADCKTLSQELNSCNKLNGMSPTARETREEAFAYNTVDSERNSDFDSMEIPAPENDLHTENARDNGGLKSTAADIEVSSDKSREVRNIRYPLLNEKPFDLDGPGEKIRSNCMDKLLPVHAQEYDDRELATISGGSQATGYGAPQMSFNSSSPFDEILGQEGENICGPDQDLQIVMGPEYMKLDVTETQLYYGKNQEDSVFLSEASMDFESNTGVELGLDASVSSQAEVSLAMAGRTLATTICVWCGAEFFHELDTELQQDSVGFMCPTCREKISKQFNGLESNFLNPHYY